MRYSHTADTTLTVMADHPSVTVWRASHATEGRRAEGSTESIL